jgi:hypothetical protein
MLGLFLFLIYLRKFNIKYMKSDKKVIRVIRYDGIWNREEVASDKRKVYLFGDNTNDRLNTHHIPTSTQACIRGLDNAIGIDTKKNRQRLRSSYFTDNDFIAFKNQVDAAIEQAKASGKVIVIPAKGIGTGKAMLQYKAPLLYGYLQMKLLELENELNNENN